MMRIRLIVNLFIFIFLAETGFAESITLPEVQLVPFSENAPIDYRMGRLHSSFTLEMDEALWKDQYLELGQPLPFVSRKEISYTLWTEMTQWARVNLSYTFGKTGSPGEGLSSFQPVTNISWYDAVLFCNAITQYSNQINHTELEFVYYKDPSFTQTYNDSRSSSVFIKDSADGYRLPVSGDWDRIQNYYSLFSDCDGLNWEWCNDDRAGSGGTQKEIRDIRLEFDGNHLVHGSIPNYNPDFYTHTLTFRVARLMSQQPE